VLQERIAETAWHLTSDRVAPIVITFTDQGLGTSRTIARFVTACEVSLSNEPTRPDLFAGCLRPPTLLPGWTPPPRVTHGPRSQSLCHTSAYVILASPQKMALSTPHAARC
jgi:hypothetical protein